MNCKEGHPCGHTLNGADALQESKIAIIKLVTTSLNVSVFDILLISS